MTSSIMAQEVKEVELKEVTVKGSKNIQSLSICHAQKPATWTP